MVFEPVGERARWRVLYDVLRAKNIGDVLSYEEAAGLLKLDARVDRHILQAAMCRAGKELEEQDKRAVENVRGVGYRVAAPAQHLVLARQQGRKARSALRRGLSKVVNVNLNGLDPATRGAFDLMARAFMQQADFNRRMLRETINIRDLVTREVERSDDQYRELKERLERLERQQDNA